MHDHYNGIIDLGNNLSVNNKFQLQDMEETEHALVFNTHRPDTCSNLYYWAVKPFHGVGNIGNAKTAADARIMAEKRLEEL